MLQIAPAMAPAMIAVNTYLQVLSGNPVTC